MVVPWSKVLLRNNHEINQRSQYFRHLSCNLFFFFDWLCEQDYERSQKKENDKTSISLFFAHSGLSAAARRLARDLQWYVDFG